MPAIKIQGFTGIAPRVSSALLSDNGAQAANNVKLQSGELRPWHKPLEVEDAGAAGAQTIYKLEGPNGSASWLSWATDVDVVTSPLGDQADYRFYYTGSGTPKKSNWAMATTGAGARPVASYEMGVPAPTAAPTLAAAGGTAPLETRSYIVTFVSTFGALKEESAPSPPATVSCNAAGSTVTVNGFSAPPAGAYNVTHRRIYRSVTGATTSPYMQVAELPVSDTTYADTKTIVQLGPVLGSLYFTPPPADLRGLVSLPNGIMAGFTKNEIWFSEPYSPHAWPVTYQLSIEFPIVGLGVYGTTLVVCTTKNPYLITGSHPASMSQEKLSMTQACVSKRSIAFDQYGVLYASPYGMVSIGPGVQDLITTDILTPDEWRTYYPASFTSMIYGNYYMAFYNNAGERNAIVLARNNDSPPMTNFDFPATALYIERATGNLFACSAQDNAIHQIDADPLNSTVFEWTSKKFVLSAPVSFACLQVNADFDDLADVTAYNSAVAEAIAANAALFAAGSTGMMGGEYNGAMYNTYMYGANQMITPPVQADLRSIRAIVYGDGVQVCSIPVVSLDPVRMPASFKAHNWEVTLSGNSPVRSFAMATSIMELKEV